MRLQQLDERQEADNEGAGEKAEQAYEDGYLCVANVRIMTLFPCHRIDLRKDETLPF